MAAFESTEQLYHVMGALFERLREAPEISERLVAGNLVVRFRWRNPDGEATVDLRSQPISWQLGASELEPDVEMQQTADVAHRFWLGRLNVPQAIATRQVIARGSVPKALRLLPAVQPAFDIYPIVLRDLGLGNLVPAAAGRPSRRRLPFLSRLLRRVGVRLPAADDPLLGLIPLVEGRPEIAPPPAAEGAYPPLRAQRKVEMLRRMELIRAFEQRLSEAYAAGELPTEAIHLSIGQEAVAVGVCSVLQATDTIATTHRGHGHMLAKGADLHGMMAEIYGRAAGLCGGRGGSMHVTDARVGALGANGIVGASALIATGAALASRLRSEQRVHVAFIGDGAVNQGMFHEAANFAAVFDLPVVFVIENNQYGEFTAVARHSRVTRLADRAAAYGFPGVRIDGNDPDAVCEAAEAAVVRARTGEGPSLIECLTYRWHGHMEGETASYRGDEEVERWKQRDPIAAWRRSLIEEGLLSDSRCREIRTTATAAVAQAREAALAAPEPAVEVLSEHVFAPEPAELYRQREAPPGVRRVTCADAIREALAEEMRRDASVFLLGEDVSHGGYFAVTSGLAEELPGRVLDTPISEYAIVGAAVGAAMAGMRPVAEILFSDFLTTCMDPLVNQAAKLRYMSGGQYALPLVVRTPGGAGLGMAAQHSQSLEALLTGIPGLIVVAPSTPADAKGLLKAAIRSSNPVLFFENKLLYLETGDVPDGDCVVPLARARIAREGSDVTLVAVGAIGTLLLAVADELAADGIEAEVIDPRTLVPLDATTIVRSVARTRRLVTVEEGPVFHGFGAEIVARVLETVPPRRLKAAPCRVGAASVPIPYARALERAAVPDHAKIRDAVLCVMGG